MGRKSRLIFSHYIRLRLGTGTPIPLSNPAASVELRLHLLLLLINDIDNSARPPLQRPSFHQVTTSWCCSGLHGMLWLRETPCSVPSGTL